MEQKHYIGQHNESKSPKQGQVCDPIIQVNTE